MKKAMALMALTILTACDYAVRNDIRNERDDRIYRAAMDDYRAGRMDAAIAGLEKAVRNGNPIHTANWKKQPAEGQVYRVYLGEKFAGMGQMQDGDVKFRCMLL